MKRSRDFSKSPNDRKRLLVSVSPGDQIEIHDCYTKVRDLGKGTYSQVYLAQSNQNMNDHVAIKHLIPDHMKFKDYIRLVKKEIAILTGLKRNDHVVKMLKLGLSRRKRDHYFIVMEYCRFDLSKLLNQKSSRWWSESQVKCYMQQLVDGLLYCHTRGVIHRDLKPQNILVGFDKCLKISDFGMACIPAKETNKLDYNVCSLWYRAPELLLGSSTYGKAVDVWALAYIFCEMFYLQPLMPGPNEKAQLDMIWGLWGTPNCAGNPWPKVHETPFWSKLKPTIQKQRDTKTRLYTCSKNDGKRFFKKDNLIHLLDGMTALDPMNRMTIEDVFNHIYFKQEPKPLTMSEMPAYNHIK